MDKWRLSKKELADQLDLSVAQVERWFFDPTSSNYSRPNIRHLRRLAEIDFILTTITKSQETIAACPDHIKKILRKHQNDVDFGNF